MFISTGLTYILPESINYRKPTLKEYALAEQSKLEQASIELVEMKTSEETKESVSTPVNSAPDIAVTPEVKPVIPDVAVTPEVKSDTPEKSN